MNLALCEATRRTTGDYMQGMISILRADSLVDVARECPNGEKVSKYNHSSETLRQNIKDIGYRNHLEQSCCNRT